METGPSVLFIDHSAAISGGEIFLLRSLAAEVPFRASVMLFEDGPLRQKLEDQGVPVCVSRMPTGLAIADAASPLSWRNLVGDTVNGIRFVFRVASAIRTSSWRVIYTNSVKAHVIGGLAARLARRRLVMHVHEHMTRANFGLWQNILLRLTAMLLPHTIVVNSNSTKLTLPRSLRKRAVVIPCPIPTPPQMSSRANSAKTVVGIVGRISHGKGQHVAIEAMRSLMYSHPDLEMRITGSAIFARDEHYARQVRELVTEWGLASRVTFVGHTDDVWTEFQEMDLLVVPSVKPEGFCQVLVEGMAAGLPVIAPREGGPAEIITDGVDGLLFEPGNSGNLAYHIRRLLVDVTLQTELTTNARLSAARYAPDRVCDTWASILLSNS